MSTKYVNRTSKLLKYIDKSGINWGLVLVGLIIISAIVYNVIKNPHFLKSEGDDCEGDDVNAIYRINEKKECVIYTCNSGYEKSSSGDKCNVVRPKQPSGPEGTEGTEGTEETEGTEGTEGTGTGTGTGTGLGDGTGAGADEGPLTVSCLGGWVLGTCDKTTGKQIDTYKYSRVEDSVCDYAHGETRTTPCAVPCEGYHDSEWGPCSKTCGGGTRTKKFNRLYEPLNGGTACPADLSEACNTQPCPVAVDCIQSEWNYSGQCGPPGDYPSPVSVTKTRQTLQESAHGGEPCGPTQETVPCDLDCAYTDYYLKDGTCDPSTGQGTYTREVLRESTDPNTSCPINEYTDTCSVNCEWNPWVTGPCITTCFNPNDTRTCTSKSTQTRTKKITESGGGTCIGLSTLTSPCFP